MCLAVPGKLIAIAESQEVIDLSGTIDFQGSRFDVNLSATPEAKIGDWLLVHAGFAISVLDEAGAKEVWDMLKHDEHLADQMPIELRDPEEATQ